jgi:23S rRNA pseudouridine1911/1915/1917 synthase
VGASEIRSLVIPPELAGVRLDVALARLAPDLTRSRVQRLVEGGRVTVAGRPAKASQRLRGGEPVELVLEPPASAGVAAQDLPLAVLFEDADVVVLDKAAGMVVHPARGSPHSTVVNALLARWGAEGQPDESAPAPQGAPEDERGFAAGTDLERREAPGGRGLIESPRLGLVHRLDKDTSGCLVVARTEPALRALQAQWKGRTVEKVYLALCHGHLAAAGRLDTPYGRHPRDRTRFTGRLRSAPRRALTEWRVVERFGDAATLAEVTLHTGRTHQIRVHLSEAGHPLLHDAVYGGTRREARAPAGLAAGAAAAIGRQALHAARLAFDHPRTGRRLSFEAPFPADFRAALEVLRAPSSAPSPAERKGRRARRVSRRS